MRVLSVLMYGLPIAVSLFIFSCGQKMSDDEAKKIINQYLKYPHPLFNGCSSGPRGECGCPQVHQGDRETEGGWLSKRGARQSPERDK